MATRGTKRRLADKEKEQLSVAFKKYKDKHGVTRKVDWEEIRREANIPSEINKEQIRQYIKNNNSTIKSGQAVAAVISQQENVNSLSLSSNCIFRVNWEKVATYLAMMGPFDYGSKSVREAIGKIEPCLCNDSLWYSSKNKIMNALSRFPEWMEARKVAEYPTTREGKEAMWKREKENLINLKAKIEEDIRRQKVAAFSTNNGIEVTAVAPIESDNNAQLHRRFRRMDGPLTLAKDHILVVTPFIQNLTELNQNCRAVIENQKLNVHEWRKLMTVLRGKGCDLLSISPTELGQILEHLKDQMEIKRGAMEIKFDYFRYVVPQLDEVCGGVLQNSLYALPMVRSKYVVVGAIYYCLLHQRKLVQCLRHFELCDVLERDSSEWWVQEIKNHVKTQPHGNFKVNEDYFNSFKTRYL